MERAPFDMYCMFTLNSLVGCKSHLKCRAPSFAAPPNSNPWTEGVSSPSRTECHHHSKAPFHSGQNNPKYSMVNSIFGGSAKDSATTKFGGKATLQATRVEPALASLGLQCPSEGNPRKPQNLPAASNNVAPMATSIISQSKGVELRSTTTSKLFVILGIFPLAARPLPERSLHSASQQRKEFGVSSLA